MGQPSNNGSRLGTRIVWPFNCAASCEFFDTFGFNVLMARSWRRDNCVQKTVRSLEKKLPILEYTFPILAGRVNFCLASMLCW
jgi:hypothetical protein